MMALLTMSKPPGFTSGSYFSKDGAFSTMATSGRSTSGAPMGSSAYDDRAVRRPAAHLWPVRGDPGHVLVLIHRGVGQHLTREEDPLTAESSND
jgi:hypothetical protein